MYQLVGYHRPGSIAEAVTLLGQPGRLAIGGGTTIRHDGGADPVEIVDLQALGLDTIDGGEGATGRIGAAVTLGSLAESDLLPDLLRRAARDELPNTLRNLATVGGTIGVADPDSVLLAALLVHDAVVHFAVGDDAALADVLRDGRSAADLIVAVTIATGGSTAFASTGRTPADTPIVAAFGRAGDDGLRLALTGVAATPVLVDPQAVGDVDPTGDFRGSAGYRRHLASVLAARAMGALT